MSRLLQKNKASPVESFIKLDKAERQIDKDLKEDKKNNVQIDDELYSQRMIEVLKEQIKQEMIAAEVEENQGDKLKVIILTERRLKQYERHQLCEYYNVDVVKSIDQKYKLDMYNCSCLVVRLNTKYGMTWWKLNKVDVDQDVDVVYIFKGKTRNKDFENMKRMYSCKYVKKKIDRAGDETDFNVMLFSDHMEKIAGCLNHLVRFFF